jgi:hypothetical protein
MYCYNNEGEQKDWSKGEKRIAKFSELKIKCENRVVTKAQCFAFSDIMKN